MASLIDVIVPAYNEAENLPDLLRRLNAALTSAAIEYHVIVVDDHSTDKTAKVLKRLAKKYPVTHILKDGERGKAFSILQGAKLSTAPYIAMIDGDLQYPPEVLPDMLKLTQQYGVVVARRRDFKAPKLRQFLSLGFQWVFGKLLYGLDCDIQSGLKVFKQDILERVDASQVTAWTLDVPLLSTALDLGYSIGQVDITFAPRVKGESKINLVTSIREIGGRAISYRLRRRDPFRISPDDETSMVGAGIIHRGKHFITHTTLETQYSALHVITAAQKFSLLAMLAVLILGLIATPFSALKIFVAILSTVYFIDVIFNLFVLIKSLSNPPEIQIPAPDTDALKDEDLPIYTIMCPLYKEAHVLPQFVENISKMDWPKSKMEVMLLLEADDVETIAAAEAMNLPEYVTVQVVPDSQPKTKPKACNYGLHYAKGEYLVIYDAEDDPDPLQLKKVYVAFQKVAANVKCIQAKLNFYNPHQNLLTRFFTAEYSLWFDVVLTGLQSINTTIPLGGTSNHFRTADLRELQGWDPFNVTEDCDLGIRLFKRGALTAVIDSVTLEEANSNWGNWLRQRSRWIKGYMQTYLVHMRNPLRFAREYGWHSTMFQLVVGGKIAFMLINPFMWLLTLSYFALYAWVGPTIEALYPNIVFYMAVTSLLFGNFMFIYYYMIGAAKREHWTIIKWVFLVPIYWLLVSVAAGIALYELIRKPHYWQKTVHGLHLKKAAVEPNITEKTVTAQNLLLHS
jgi:cellulose synthase/poly-beta-1,6-N-acetylglucosamine synthase-like glycosyltransferase